MKQKTILDSRTAKPLSKLLRQNDGTSIPELAFVLPVLALLLITAIDLGRAYFYTIAASSAAHAAAAYGVQNPTDTAGMTDAAALSASSIPSLVTNITHGCECYDGSSSVTNCTTAPSCLPNNYVNFVNITTTATYTTLIPYPGLPKSFAISGSAFMRSGGD